MRGVSDPAPLQSIPLIQDLMEGGTDSKRVSALLKLSRLWSITQSEVWRVLRGLLMQLAG